MKLFDKRRIRRSGDTEPTDPFEIEDDRSMVSSSLSDDGSRSLLPKADDDYFSTPDEDGSECGDSSRRQQSAQSISDAPPVMFSPEAFNFIDGKNLNEEDGRKFKIVGGRNGLVFKMLRNDSILVSTILYSHGFKQAGPLSTHFNLLWTGVHLKPRCMWNLAEHQRANHFPRSFELSRKDRLYENIAKMQRQFGESSFAFIPEFYVTPVDFERFRQQYNRNPASTLKAPYIVKPVGLSRGRGIFLATHPSQIPLATPMLVSRYINKPLLINGHKFDVRLYVAVTSFHPLVAYMYYEGLVRFAAEKYTTHAKNFDQTHVHLTNYSINKYSKKYIKNDSLQVEDAGHKWTLGALLRYLRDQTNIDVDFLMLRIEDLVVKTLLAAQSPIGAACQAFVPFEGNCFELFGFDILIDAQLKPWLLEVNLSPSLSCDTPLDLKVKSHMMCDLFNLASMPNTNPLNADYDRRQLIRRYRVSPKLSPSSKRAKISPRKTSRRPLSATIASRIKKRAMNLSNSVEKSRRITANNQRQNLSRNMSTSARVENQYRRVIGEQRRRGGFIRLIPRHDTSQLYFPYFGQVQPNYDHLLHERLYSNNGGGINNNDENRTPIYTSERSDADLDRQSSDEQQSQFNSRVSNEASEALVDYERIFRSNQLRPSVRGFLQPSLDRCRLYASTKQLPTNSLRESLPRMRSSQRLRTKSFIQFEIDAPKRAAASGGAKLQSPLSDMVMNDARDLALYDKLTPFPDIANYSSVKSGILPSIDGQSSTDGFHIDVGIGAIAQLSLVQARQVVDRYLTLVLRDAVAAKLSPMTSSTQQMLALTGVIDNAKRSISAQSMSKENIDRLKSFVERYRLYTRRLQTMAEKENDTIEGEKFAKMLHTSDRRQLEKLLVAFYRAKRKADKKYSSDSSNTSDSFTSRSSTKLPSIY